MGLRLEQRVLLVGNYLPLEQGLKRDVNQARRVANKGRKLPSIRTRIETIEVIRRSTSTHRVGNYLPLEQGLKQGLHTVTKESLTTVGNYLPLEQGLKLRRALFAVLFVV